MNDNGCADDYWSVCGKHARLFASIGLLGAVLFFLADRIDMMPENARVIVDYGTQTYASVPCVVHGNLEREAISNRADAADPSKDLQLLDETHATVIGQVRGWNSVFPSSWKPDKKCSAADGFTQIITFWNRVFGYRSRWTADGEWLW
jgi:hypothetical protein